MLPRLRLPVNPFRSSGLGNRGELPGLPGWAAMPLTEGTASTRLVILRVRPDPVNLFLRPPEQFGARAAPCEL